MYRIYCDDVCIYDDIRPDVDSKVINPKLTMEENSAGQLSFQMPPGNIGYDLVKRMDSLITVYLEDEVIWEGRVISEDEDYFNQRNVVCEGALAFLNDTIQPPAEYHNISPRVFLERLIAIHNSKSDLQFTVGIVTVVDDDTTNSNDELYRYTNYESTLECIKDKLVDRLKGFLKIRKVNGVRYIDYLAEHTETNDQVIRFETNLLDFTRSWDLSDMATVIVPRGARLDENPPGYPSALEAYLTVESVNQGSIYVQNTQAVAAFGWICKVVDWSDVTVASNLLTKAQKYLQDEQFDQMTLELNAVDLHYLSKSNRPFKMYERIRCVSRPHGMDKLFPITKMEIQLDNPENTTYTLGSKEIPSLTARTAKVNLDVTKAIEDLPSKSEILRSAQENAKNMLMGVDGGYVKTIVNNNNQPEQIWIQNKLNNDVVDGVTTDVATQRWIWNVRGLGFVERRRQEYPFDLDPRLPWTTLKAAITMDGSIVADRITTGTMYADRIKGGTLTLGGNNNGNGKLSIKDSAGTTEIGRWDKDGIYAATGTFAGNLSAAGGTFAGNLSAAGGTFKGSLSAATGTFAGNLSAAGGSFKGSLSAATGTFAGDLSAAGGTFKGSLSAATGTFAGNLSAAGGSFKGSLSAATGTFAGDLSAAGGTFKGSLSAATGSFSGQVSASSGNIAGITIVNDNVNGHGLFNGLGTDNAVRLTKERGVLWAYLNGNSWGMVNTLPNNPPRDHWHDGKVTFYVHNGSISVDDDGSLSEDGNYDSNRTFVTPYNFSRWRSDVGDDYVIWVNESDRRLKKDIKDISGTEITSFFDKIHPKSFKYNDISPNDSKYLHHGVIAQDIVEEFGDTYDFAHKNTMDYYHVNYMEFHGMELAGIKYLLDLVQQQQKEIDILKEAVNGNT